LPRIPIPVGIPVAMPTIGEIYASDEFLYFAFASAVWQVCRVRPHGSANRSGFKLDLSTGRPLSLTEMLASALRREACYA